MQAPDHLGLKGKAFWSEVLDENPGFGPEDFALLEIACESQDTIESCRRRLAKEGLIIHPPPHKSPKPHPAVEIRRNAQIRYEQAIKTLDLGPEPEEEPRVRRIPRAKLGRPTAGTTPGKMR